MPNRRADMTPLAIIGMSCFFPKANNLREYWSNIVNKVDAITEVPDSHWNPDEYFDADPKKPDHTYARRGGFLSAVPFDPTEFGISPNTLEAIDTSQLLGLMAARDALEDAGYGAGREFDRDKVSVLLGVTGTLELVIPLGARLGHPLWRQALAAAGVDEATAADVVNRISDGYVPWQEESFPGLLGNVVAGRIANRLDLGGTNCVVDAACASSLSALHLAALELSSGKADMVITGGCDTFNDIFMYMCFSKTPALSPTGNAKPFDANADGTILGEGLGMIVVKRLADAERDGDNIYAVIRGVGTASDGRGKAIYAPQAQGQIKALREAYQQAGVSPATVEMVEAHGTGTKVGDATEVTALREVYGEAARPGAWCALGSVKSQIGHTKAAAGAASLIKAALALKHKVLPPTIKVDEANPAVTVDDSPFYLNLEKRPWLPAANHPRRAAVSSFGFGGSNFHLVLEEHEAQKQDVDWPGTVQLVAVSARSLGALKSKLNEWGNRVREHAAEKWDEIARAAAASRREFAADDSYRLVVVLDRASDGITNLCHNALARLEQGYERVAWAMEDCAFFSSHPGPGKLGMLFPGQGAQYVNMALDLACHFPEVHETLIHANEIFAESMAESKDTLARLSDHIYPPKALTDAVRKANELALQATHVAQPAIGAVSVGALSVLATFGVQADAVAGHSYGELSALHAAGRIDATTLHQLSNLRGQLMRDAAQGEAGAMLAVKATVEEIERVIAEERLEVVVANRNSPMQTVLAGTSEAIERALASFRSRKVSVAKLPVAAAFHSPLVAGAATPFRAALNDVRLAPARMPVFANTTGETYPEDEAAARDLLGQQLARPVEFVQLLENMYAAGVRTFLDIAPAARLTGLVKATLGEREHVAFAVEATSGRQGWRDLAATLAHLAALGHAVDLRKWEKGDTLPEPQPRKMTVHLSGSNYRSPQASVDSKPVSTNPKPIEPSNPMATALPAPVAGASPAYVDALRSAQEGLAALQKLQAQTAELHRQFLEGQHTAQLAMSQLLDRQQHLFAHTLGAAPAPVFAPVAPIATPPPESRSAIPQIPSPAAPPIAPVPPAPLLATSPAPATSVSVAPAISKPPPTTATTSAIQTTVLGIVSEKTGYPVEMLSLDMDMESDLGIDSIKRVEILSEVQERMPDAPVVQPEQIGLFRTLRQVMEYLAASATAETPAAPGRMMPGANTKEVSATVLGIVSEKTGYPVEMLHLDMDMESDLGIDSIKRVEILSEVQERMPDAPVVQPEQIGEFRTLRQVMEYLEAGSPAPAPHVISTSTTPSATNTHATSATVLGIVSEKTGYPVEMLNLDMDMESDLGIDSIKRVEILSEVQERMPDAPVVQPEQIGLFRTLRQVIEYLQPSAPAASAARVSESATSAMMNQSPTAARLQRSVLVSRTLTETFGERMGLGGSEIWISDDRCGLASALAEELTAAGLATRLINGKRFPRVKDTLAGLVIVAPASSQWSEKSDAFLKNAFALVRYVGPQLRAAGKRGGALLATTSRLDGHFGLANNEDRFDPTQGALAGLAKTARQEWNEVTCKAIDVDCAWAETNEAARELAIALLHTTPVEVGLSAAGRCTPVEVDAAATAEAGPMQPGDVIVITGGGRGVTAECALALAREFQPTLVLLGRTALDEEPAWLRALEDQRAIKQAIVAHANDNALTPKALEEEYRRIAAQREVRNNLRRLEAAGARVAYHAVDVRNQAAIGALFDEARRSLGPIRGLVHGAGVLADRLIEDKTPEQFDAVFDTKVGGLQALLRALAPDDLKWLVFFSSVSGRYGRAGQVDYAMANEALNKIAQEQARRRPHTRVVAINWGPWEGGMVNATLGKLFRSQGVELIPLAAGAQALVAELRVAPGGEVEVIMGGRCGEPTGATERRFAEGRLSACNAQAGQFTLAFERALDARRYEFLQSHQLNAKPVLPAAMMMEWMAHAALVQNPGLVFHGIDNFRVLKGVVLENCAPYWIRAVSTKAAGGGETSTVTVELRGGEAEIAHARADVVLATRLPPGTNGQPQLPLAPYSRSIESAYGEILFHGPHFRAIEAVEGCSSAGIAASVTSAPTPTNWMQEPLRSAWLSDPLAIDAAFQLMILWTYDQCGAFSLPTCFERYRQYREFPRQGVRALARAARNGASVARADIEFVAADGSLVATMEGYECVMSPSLRDAFGR